MNPRDVVTILLTNPDKVPMSKFDAVFKKVGLDTIAFKPSTSPNPLAMGDWPTLGSILNDGRRLITFMGTETPCRLLCLVANIVIRLRRG